MENASQGNNSRRAFVKWFPYDKRNDAIGNALNARCHYISYGQAGSGSKWNAIWRYPLQFFKTLWVLLGQRPERVLVTNPPIFATLAVALYSGMTGTRYAMDSHSDAFGAKWKRVEWLHRWLARRAICVMVTNEKHAQHYAAWGARPFVLSDVMVAIESGNRARTHDEFTVAVICSFASDEPIEEIFAAARQAPRVMFYMTGNAKRCPSALLENKPVNLRLTGFLPDKEFFDLLWSSDCIMTLTTRDNTMQNAAYEALSMSKPMILSDWPLLKGIYGEAALYVDNSGNGIAQAVAEMAAHLPLRKQAVAAVCAARADEWRKKTFELEDMLGAGNGVISQPGSDQRT